MTRLNRDCDEPTPAAAPPEAERRHALVGPANLWAIKREFQIRFLKAMKLAPESYLFDVGCGTLRGGLPLIEYLHEGHYFGCEVREHVLNEGRLELQEAGLNWKNPVLLLTPDISRLNVDRKFDFIWAFSVLIHMKDEVLDSTLAFASRHLSDNGVFYANINAGCTPDGEWQGFPVVWRTLDFYQSACARHGLTLSDLGPLSAHGHVLDVAAQDHQRMLRIMRFDSSLRG